MATYRMPAIVPKLTIEPPRPDFISSAGDADVQVAAKGLMALAQTLKSMPRVFRDAAGVEMEKIAAEILEDSKANYVPRDTYALYDSGDHDQYDPTTSQQITEIAIWYGAPLSENQQSGGEVAVTFEGERFTAKGKGSRGQKPKRPELYALDQHENMSYRHDAPYGPKYLERPFMKVANSISARIARAAGVAFGGGSSLAEINARLEARPTYPGYGTPRMPK